MHVIVLLIDERPEEVTDISAPSRGDVIYSTLTSSRNIMSGVAEMVLAHAQRWLSIAKM